jgi:zinc protease
VTTAAPLTTGHPSVSASPSLISPLEIHHRELPNGLNILVQPDHSAPVVSVQYWCGTGSIHEGEWLGSGLSHLLEHLMFKGTPSLGNSEMARRIQDLGGHMNAYTSFDRTVYYVDLPSAHWQGALDLWTDALQNSLLPETEFEPEREVIRREFAMGDDSPDSVLTKLLFHTAFTTHPYRMPVIGHLDLFNALTREQVHRYYRERYTPQNLTLILVGAVDPAAVFAHAEKLWAAVPRRFLPDPVSPSEPPLLTPRSARRPFPTELVRLALLYHIPGQGHADNAALHILALILGHGRSARFYQTIVEKEGLAEDLDTFAYTPAQVGLFGVEARCTPSQHELLLPRLRELLHTLAENLPTAPELARAQRQCLSQQIHQLKTMSGKASTIGNGWLMARDPHYHQSFLRQLQGVTLADLTRVITAYLQPEKQLCVELVPLEEAPLTQAAAAPTLAPAPQLLSSLPQRRILHLASDKVPLTAFRATLPGGLLWQPPGKEGLSRLTAQMLLKGTRTRTAETLAREVEELGGYLQADSGNNSATLALELLAEDTARGLEIFLEVLTEPHFTAEELATEKRKQLAAIQAEHDQPMAVCRDLLRRTLYTGHPYATSLLGTKESVAGITLEDVHQFARDVFQSSDLVLSVAGPRSAADWLSALQDRTASFAPSPALAALALPPCLSLQRVHQAIPKEQAILQFAFPIPGANHPDQVPLSIVNEALADLGTRLFVRIREQLGLAYFVSASRFLGSAGGYFVFFAGTDPQRRDLVEAAMLEEIRRLATGGLTSEEIERARAKVLSEDKINAQNPAGVAAGAALDELLGLGYSYYLTRQKRLANLSHSEINTVIRHYFDHENFVIATVSPP